MAVEKVFGYIRQDILEQAAKESEHGTELLRQGDADGARVSLGEASIKIGKAEFVDKLKLNILGKLKEAGIEDPSAELLNEFLGIQTEKTALSKTNTSSVEKSKSQILIMGKMITNLKPVEVSILEKIPQAKEETILRSELMALTFPDLELNVADRKLAKTMFELKPKLAKEGLEIVNPISRRDMLTGTSARYQFREVPKEAQIELKISSFTSEVKRTDLDEETIQPDNNVTELKINSNTAKVSTGFEDSETEEYPLLTEEILKNFNPIQQNFLKSLTFNPEQLFYRSRAQELFPDEDPKKAKTKLSEIMILMKDKLTKNKLRIVNPVTRKEVKAGVEAGYYLERINTETEEINTETLLQQDMPLSSEETANVPESLQITDSEVHYLAQKLYQKNPGALNKIGLELASEDRDELGRIIDKLESFPELSKDNPQAREGLIQRLKVYIQDRQRVFMENLDNEDAQFVLTAIAPLESEEQLAELLDSV